MKRAHSHEKGMITVEAILSLVPFILVILGIISFINIFMVHNKVQYAMYQAGNELTAYTYFYQALGLRDADLGLKADIDRETAELDDTIAKTTDFLDQLDTLTGSAKKVGSGDLGELENTMNQAQGTVQAGQAALSSGWELISDPQDLLRNLVYYGIEAGETALKGWLMEVISRSMLPAYLDSSFSPSNPMNADQYLKSFGIVNGVKGLDFSNSTAFTDEDYRMLDLVVEYDMEIFYFKLFFKNPAVHVVQRCSIPAWLDGDGVHYED